LIVPTLEVDDENTVDELYDEENILNELIADENEV